MACNATELTNSMSQSEVLETSQNTHKIEVTLTQSAPQYKHTQLKQKVEDIGGMIWREDNSTETTYLIICPTTPRNN